MGHNAQLKYSPNLPLFQPNSNFVEVTFLLVVLRVQLQRTFYLTKKSWPHCLRCRDCENDVGLTEVSLYLEAAGLKVTIIRGLSEKFSFPMHATTGWGQQQFIFFIIL